MISIVNQQTLGDSNCTDTTALRDKLTGCLIGLARATFGNEDIVTPATAAVVIDGLSATIPDAHTGSGTLLAILERVDEEKRKLVPSCYICTSPCGRNNDYDIRRLQKVNEDTRCLKLQILSGIRSIAATHQVPGCADEATVSFLYRALFAIGEEDWGQEELQPILLEMDKRTAG